LIFVTVGTHYQKFTRLVQKMDYIAANLSEEVIIQYGHTTIDIKHARGHDFIDTDTYNSLLNDARVIVTHDGAGAMIASISAGKQVVVVPRLQQYGELLYRNRAELAKKLESMGLLHVICNVEEIPEALANVMNSTPPEKAWVSHRTEFIDRIKGYLKKFGNNEESDNS